jgi:hypothetical protein
MTPVMTRRKPKNEGGAWRTDAPTGADRARLTRIESQLDSDDRLARLEAQQAAIQATLSERRVAETEAAEAIQRKLEETAKAAADALKSALDSANVIELERVSRVSDRIAAVERAAEVALATSDKAVTLNREDALRTEMKQNEFRGTLEDQNKRVESTMIRRTEFEQAITALASKIDGAINNWAREHQALVQHHESDLSEVRQALVAQPELRALERGQQHTAGQAEGATSTADRAFYRGLSIVMALIAAASVIALILHG